MLWSLVDVSVCAICQVQYPNHVKEGNASGDKTVRSCRRFSRFAAHKRLTFSGEVGIWGCWSKGLAGWGCLRSHTSGLQVSKLRQSQAAKTLPFGHQSYSTMPGLRNRRLTSETALSVNLKMVTTNLIISQPRARMGMTEDQINTDEDQICKPTGKRREAWKEKCSALINECTMMSVISMP